MIQFLLIMTYTESGKTYLPCFTDTLIAVVRDVDSGEVGRIMPLGIAYSGTLGT